MSDSGAPDEPVSDDTGPPAVPAEAVPEGEEAVPEGEEAAPAEAVPEGEEAAPAETDVLAVVRQLQAGQKEQAEILRELQATVLASRSVLARLGLREACSSRRRADNEHGRSSPNVCFLFASRSTIDELVAAHASLQSEVASLKGTHGTAVAPPPPGTRVRKYVSKKEAALQEATAAVAVVAQRVMSEAGPGQTTDEEIAGLLAARRARGGWPVRSGERRTARAPAAGEGGRRDPPVRAPVVALTVLAVVRQAP